MSLDVYLYAPAGDNESAENEVYWSNITHNLNCMAEEAGIYMQLWRPEEIGICKASELVEPLEAGLIELATNKDKYEAMNPKNGWGSWQDFVIWLAKYLAACKKYPDALVRVSR